MVDANREEGQALSNTTYHLSYALYKKYVVQPGLGVLSQLLMAVNLFSGFSACNLFKPSEQSTHLFRGRESQRESQDVVVWKPIFA